MANFGARASIPLWSGLVVVQYGETIGGARPENRATERILSLDSDLKVFRKLNTSPNGEKVRYSYLVEIQRERERAKWHRAMEEEGRREERKGNCSNEMRNELGSDFSEF